MAQRLTAAERKHRNAQRQEYAQIVGDFERDKRRLHDLAAKMIDSESAVNMLKRGENPLGAQ